MVKMINCFAVKLLDCFVIIFVFLSHIVFHFGTRDYEKECKYDKFYSKIPLYILSLQR